MEEPTKLFRYRENSFGYETTLICEEYKIISATPCGWWIRRSSFLSFDKKRWVSSSGKKRFAYPTKEEALKAYTFRKRRHIAILRSQMEVAKDGMDIAKAMLDREITDPRNIRVPVKFE